MYPIEGLDDALCSFFEEQAALPDRPLIALVPTIVRCRDQDSEWSRVPLLVNLGTDLGDPVERLHCIARSLEYSRDRDTGLSAAESQVYTLRIQGPGLLNPAAPSVRRQAAVQPGDRRYPIPNRGSARSIGKVAGWTACIRCRP